MFLFHHIFVMDLTRKAFLPGHKVPQAFHPSWMNPHIVNHFILVLFLPPSCLFHFGGWWRFLPLVFTWQTWRISLVFIRYDYAPGPSIVPMKSDFRFYLNLCPQNPYLSNSCRCLLLNNTPYILTYIIFISDLQDIYTYIFRKTKSNMFG